MATASPMAVVPPTITTGKVRKRAAVSRTSVDVQSSKDDGLTSPRRNTRKAREIQASLPSLEASQTVHQTETFQPDGKAPGSLQAQARIADRPTTSQTNLEQQQQRQQTAWTARALDLCKNVNGHLSLTPRRPQPFVSGQLSEDSAPTSLRNIARHPFVPWFLSLAVAAVLAGFFVSSVGRSAPPARVGDQVLADNFADVRQQVKEVETKMERIIKHVQAEIDAVDKSVKKNQKWVEEEIKKTNKDIETSVKVVASQMELLEGQVRQLLGAPQALSEVEVRELVHKVVETRAAVGKGQAISLDDVRAAARSVVLNELDRHVADGGASGPDYALESGGGQVVAHSHAKWSLPGPVEMVALGVRTMLGHKLHPMAQTILRPKLGVPGDCFPFTGSNGTIDVLLRSHIKPSAIALEHISKIVAFEVTSAPRKFAIYGWSSEADTSNNERAQSLLGEFEYDIGGSVIQEFPLVKSASAVSSGINMIRLHVASNHGHAEHTCIYRLRVHGTPVAAPSPTLASIGEPALAV